MRHFARVCVVGLLCDGQSHEPRGGDIARFVGGVAPYLIDAVALLRTGAVSGPRLEAARRQCAELSAAALLAEFRMRVAALGDMGLPPLLVAHRLDVGKPARPESPLPPLVALRVLAGTAGGLFLRAREPGPAQFMQGLPGGCPDGLSSFDYWLAEDLEESLY